MSNLPDMGGMHVVEALSDARAFDTSGRESFALTAGLQYVVHDPEAEGGVRDGAFKVICKLDELLPRYDGQPLANARMLMTHIGGMGDGLVLAACLKALKERYPDCTIDVACPALHHPLMKLVDADLNIMPYPPPVSELKHYSYYMSLEDVDRHATDAAMSNIQIFGNCLRTPEATEAVKLKLPSALLEEWDIGPARQPRVGIALTKSVHMKAYPVDLALKLVQALLKKDVAVLLFGASNEIGRDLPHAPPMLFNLVDKTPDIASLAAIFSQLDAVVCPDTMFMHLAGALRLPTLTIFTCTHVSAAGGYPTVRLATADVPCRPCGAVAHTCPIGHSACIVPRHADLAPRRLAAAVMDLLRTRPTADQSPLANMSDSR